MDNTRGRKPDFSHPPRPNMFRRFPDAIGVYGCYTFRDAREARVLTAKLRQTDPQALEVISEMTRFQARIHLGGVQYLICSKEAFKDPTPEQINFAKDHGHPRPKGGVELAAEAYDNAAYYTRHFQNPPKELNFPENYETDPPPPTEATRKLVEKLEAQASVDGHEAFRTTLKPLASARVALVATLENSPHLSEDAQDEGFKLVALLRFLEERIPNLLPNGSMSVVETQRLDALLCDDVVQTDTGEGIPVSEVASFVADAIKAALEGAKERPE